MSSRSAGESSNTSTAGAGSVRDQLRPSTALSTSKSIGAKIATKNNPQSSASKAKSAAAATNSKVAIATRSSKSASKKPLPSEDPHDDDESSATGAIYIEETKATRRTTSRAQVTAAHVKMNSVIMPKGDQVPAAVQHAESNSTNSETNFQVFLKMVDEKVATVLDAKLEEFKKSLQLISMHDANERSTSSSSKKNSAIIATDDHEYSSARPAKRKFTQDERGVKRFPADHLPASKENAKRLWHKLKLEEMRVELEQLKMKAKKIKMKKIIFSELASDGHVQGIAIGENTDSSF